MRVPYTKWRVEYEADERIRRFLRARNVLTTLSAAGLFLTLAGLSIVIGIGQVQITAGQGRSGDLFGDGWFDVGLALAGIGILLAGLAMFANTSQATARREFPDLKILIYAAGNLDTSEPGEAPSGGRQVRLAHFGVRIGNRERDRTASIAMFLHWDVLPTARKGLDSLLFVPRRWDPVSSSPAMTLHPLRLPVHLDPQTTVEGDVLFEIPGYEIQQVDFDSIPRIEVLDRNSGTQVTLLGALGSSYDRASQALRQPER